MLAMPERPLEVTIFDPLTKVGYSLVYGGEASDVLPTEGLISWMGRKGKSVKRMFLCKRFLACKCRAMGECKSAHVDRKKVASMRKLHPQVRAEEKVTVTVPMVGKNIRVPKSSVITMSVPAAGTPSLCTASPCVGCNNNVHVSASYLGHLKTLLKQACCSRAECLLPAATLRGVRIPHATFIVKKHDAVDISYLAQTKGLIDLAAKNAGSPVLDVPRNQICKMHQKISCKWGLECANIHMCRELYGKTIGRQVCGHSGSGSSTSDSTSMKHSESDEEEDGPPQLLEEDSDDEVY